MTVLVFVKPVDISGQLTSDVHVMDVIEDVSEARLYLDSIHAHVNLHGFYAQCLPSVTGVRVYKWMYDQQNAWATLSASAFTELSSIPTPPILFPNGSSVRLPVYKLSGLNDPLTWPDTAGDTEPACFCPSPSEHQEHCQYIQWKRGTKK